jgi:hypothetical protein
MIRVNLAQILQEKSLRMSTDSNQTISDERSEVVMHINDIRPNGIHNEELSPGYQNKAYNNKYQTENGLAYEELKPMMSEESPLILKGSTRHHYHNEAMRL